MELYKDDALMLLSYTSRAGLIFSMYSRSLYISTASDEVIAARKSHPVSREVNRLGRTEENVSSPEVCMRAGHGLRHVCSHG